MRFLTRRARTNGTGRRQCARCGGALTYADEWGQRCPHCFQWLPFRNVLAPDGAPAVPATDAALLGAGMDSLDTGATAGSTSGNGHSQAHNGAHTETATPAGAGPPTSAP